MCLDDFAGLHLRREIRRHGRDERDRAVRRAAQHDDALEPAFQRVGDRLQKVAVHAAEIVDDGGMPLTVCARSSKFARGVRGFALHART